MNTIFPANLRRLRQEKHLTQEQAAACLQVSPQAVSRWENGVTYPDVLLLPEISHLYGVLVDDLFRPAPMGYKNQAIRLLAVYERSHRPEYFLAAAQAFEKIPQGGAADAEDYRSCGVLHEYMASACSQRAFSLYDRGMEMSRSEAPEMYHRIQRQKNQLRSRLGQDAEAIAEQEEAVRRFLDDPEEWGGLAVAHLQANETAQALAVCQEALARFPDCAGLHAIQGDAYRALKHYDAAFPAWKKAYALDPAGWMHGSRQPSVTRSWGNTAWLRRSGRSLPLPSASAAWT